MRELRFEELTLDQKLGMVICGHATIWRDAEANYQYTLEKIRKRELGCVWVNPTFPNAQKMLDEIRAAADYPIVIVTDAESGIGEYAIGQHGSLGLTNSTKHAYTFGKVTGIVARKMGYNMVCDPVVDMAEQNYPCNTVTRSLGGDPKRVSEMAIAISRGMHDAGVLSVAKHYPSVPVSSIRIWRKAFRSATVRI